MEGLSQSGVITTYKHFPGAGDGSDYPTSIKMTLEQLERGGLFAFGRAIANGAEMVMTSATTFPLIDDEVLMADGSTKGYAQNRDENAPGGPRFRRRDYHRRP